MIFIGIYKEKIFVCFCSIHIFLKLIHKNMLELKNNQIYQVHKADNNL